MTQQYVSASQAVMPVILMETDVAVVTAGGNDYGWVSGSLANLAASATVNCLFDLGPNWQQYIELQIIILPTGTSSGLSSVTFTSRDDATAVNNAARRLNQRYGTGANGGSIFASLTTASGAEAFNVRPMGRYLVVTATNADVGNAQGATSKVTVAAYPN